MKPTSVVTSGGRVLAVTAVAHGGISEARERAYVAVRSIRFQDVEIGWAGFIQRARSRRKRVFWKGGNRKEAVEAMNWVNHVEGEKLQGGGF